MLRALLIIAGVSLMVGLFVVFVQPDLGLDRQSSEATIDAGTEPSAPAPASRTGSVASLLGGLEERLRQNPDNGKDWLLLAKSYDHLGRQQEAINAYKKAAELGVTDPTLEAKFLAGHFSLKDGSAD